MRSFLLDRIRLVNELIVGGPEVAYADLVLILTAVISACSACRWPERNLDRYRFVELLVRSSTPEAHCDYICLLSLMIAGLISERDTPWGLPGKSSRILRDDEIDLAFSDAQSRFPHIPMLELKKHTYAPLIYSWLRCAYSHENGGTSSGRNTNFSPRPMSARRQPRETPHWQRHGWLCSTAFRFCQPLRK